MPRIPLVRTFRSDEMNTAVDDAVRTRYQTADQIRNNSIAYMSSNSLVFPIASNAKYAIKICIHFSSPIAAGILVKFLMPQLGTSLIAPWSGSASAVDSNLYHSATATGIVFAEGAGVDISRVLRPRGIITTGSSGNLIVQFAQNAVTLGDTRLRVGSWARLYRVA